MSGTGVSGTTACNGSTALATGFHAWADPIAVTTGHRHFLINTTGTVWQSDTAIGTTGSDSAAPSAGVPIQ